MYISRKGHNNTIQVYSVSVVTHVMALDAGQSSQGTSEPITPASNTYNMCHNGHVINMYGVLMVLMDNLHACTVCSHCTPANSRRSFSQAQSSPTRTSVLFVMLPEYVCHFYQGLVYTKLAITVI